MATSKARVYTCCALTLLCVVGESQESPSVKCPDDTYSRAAVAAESRTCSGVGPQCPADTYSRAAVAADSDKCSEVGRDILQRGGSAVDGAIAALLCTSVINPQSAGIGGGSMFTVMDRFGKVKIINSRETVPRKFKPDLLKSCPKTFQLLQGGQWIGVPGEIQGYQQAHRLYGRLPWATLFQPTIQMAREGFPMPEVQSHWVQEINKSQAPALWDLYSDGNGTLLKTNDTVKFEKLADTLEMIAKHGADTFYTGQIAEDLIRDIEEAGGSLTVQDLASYRATVTDAWAVPLGEYQMYIPPPPAGGVILSFILNIMKGYDLNPASLTGEQKTLTYHRYVEALKFANGLKKSIHQQSSSEMARKFTEDSFAEHIRSLISSDKANDPEYYNMTQYPDSMGTTHVSVLAEDGSAVSVTSSINQIFGSRVYSPRTGVILNNQLADFCGFADNISPGEQPPSSMAPTVLKSQSKTLVIGASGGSMITTGIASTLMNHLWFGKNLTDAINASVVFVNSENALKFEPKFDETVIKGLKALGHKQEEATRFYNVVNAVEKENGSICADCCICAVSDTRKNGKAAGYCDRKSDQSINSGSSGVSPTAHGPPTTNPEQHGLSWVKSYLHSHSGHYTTVFIGLVNFFMTSKLS
ncbi:glutathione hydrolase 5 proenzyme-like isoform X2 [Toxotes jaculatrix]|uniref:glutathione hydrolase 5 proenzyme-like isoform X2 n=1 Tax=Toxotes jaculatrix TaxID=941984 RepID=UPI001B3AA1C5|nr:glutathione hydrolase 5 proenzyme-like isoform X2 [Toxotes jaculatrix]